MDMDAGCPHQPPLRDAMIPIVKPDYVVVVDQPGGYGQHTAVAVPVGGAPHNAYPPMGHTPSGYPVTQPMGTAVLYEGQPNAYPRR